MSAHYSKFLLNTYSGTPYFLAHVPDGYPLTQVLLKCRAFRRLPANLRTLAGLAKEWATKNGHPAASKENGIDSWYDDKGYELESLTGKRLTDAEIDADWARWDAPDIEVKDIPVPDGGFPDPDTWQPKDEASAADDEGDEDGPTEEQVLSDIAGHGRARVARTYGVSDDVLAGIESDKELAHAILNRKRR